MGNPGWKSSTDTKGVAASVRGNVGCLGLKYMSGRRTKKSSYDCGLVCSCNPVSCVFMEQ